MATRPIVPRADNEGGIGTTLKRWATGFIKVLTVDSITIGALSAKNPPIDADKAVYRDSTAADSLVTSTWTQIKAFLGLAITAGKTITCTQDTTLDEAGAMSSKAPKANPVFTGLSTNPSIKSFSGSIASPSGTAVTIFTLSGVAGMYLVSAKIAISEDMFNYGAFATIVAGSSARIVANNTGYMELSLSGANVQVNQYSGGVNEIVWSVLRIEISA